jgi:RNA polymerase sigma-70 factor (ECF subfamily)
MRETLFNEKEIFFKNQTGIDFQSTYKKYYPKLVYYVNKMCKDESLSEDIASDSFMMALDKINKYDKSKSQFSTWLFTIAKNITLQSIKDSKKTLSMDNELDNEGTTMKDFIESETYTIEGDNYESIIDKKSFIIKEQIESLKEPYKTVIKMREIEKMAYKDISDKLGRNLSTIKSQIRGARKIIIEKTEHDFKMIDKLYQ